MVVASEICGGVFNLKPFICWLLAMFRSKLIEGLKDWGEVDFAGKAVGCVVLLLLTSVVILDPEIPAVVLVVPV